MATVVFVVLAESRETPPAPPVMAVKLSKRLWPEAVPAFATKRAPRRKTRGALINDVALAMGAPLMPWQQTVCDVATEYKVRDLIPYRKTVLVTVPRQSGKSFLVSAIATEHCLAFPMRYVVLVAQTRIAATSRLRDIANHLTASKLDPDAVFRRGVGNESITFANGSRIVVQSPKSTSVHGESVTLGIIDEAFAVPSDVLSGIVPAMAAQPQAQLWVISTAGNESSEMLNEMVERGRDNPDGDLAFFEWSLPSDAQIYDQERWPEFMPALGHTVTVGAVAAAQSVLSLPEFRRAFGNITIREDNAAAIPRDWWMAGTVDLLPEQGMTIAVDVNRSPPGWAISATWPTDGGYHGDCIAHSVGLELTEIPYRVRDLTERFNPTALGLDPLGPAASLLPEFQAIARDHAIPLTIFNGRTRARADVALFELIRAGLLTHSTMESLDAAVEGTYADERSGIWFFSRQKSYCDVSPLLSLSMAAWLAKEDAALAPVFKIY